MSQARIAAVPKDWRWAGHAKGRLDAEGSGIGLPVNRQAPTGAVWSGTIRLWNDV